MIDTRSGESSDVPSDWMQDIGTAFGDGWEGELGVQHQFARFLDRLSNVQNQHFGEDDGQPWGEGGEEFWEDNDDDVDLFGFGS